MIPLFKPYISPSPYTHLIDDSYLIDTYQHILNSGYLAEGEEVVAFEQEFGDFIDYHHCLAVNSCTSALHLSLIASGAGPGTSVISTPMTAEPTNLAVLYTGARLIWADVHPHNGNINWTDAISKVRHDTVAIICVHYGGIPALDEDMWEVPNYVTTIEDCAHALGATWNGHHVGVLSDFGAFSFQAIKFATTGDGGMLAHNGDTALLRRLRWFGIDRKSKREDVNITHIGYKYNMNNLTAAMGRVQLAHISPIIAKHKENAKCYESQLSTISGVDCAQYDSACDPSHWFFTLLLPSQSDRDSLARRLTEEGIGNGTVHRRNDEHEVFEESGCDLPGLDEFYTRMLHVPCGWWVTEEDREIVMEVVRGG